MEKKFKQLELTEQEKNKVILESLALEIKRQKQWINDLQSGMYINCVYCGHRYGPKNETPSSMADVLKDHIEKCQSHPMFQLKKEFNNVVEIKLERGDLLCKIGNELGVKYPLENKEEILKKIKKLIES